MLDQNDAGHPQQVPDPVTDPVVIEDITAAYLLAVYEAKVLLRERLAGLAPPPGPDRVALALLKRGLLLTPALRELLVEPPVPVCSDAA